MARKPPNIKAPDPRTIAPDLQSKRVGAKLISMVCQVREYELITPLFGGGTETQKADPVSVIRGPSIRGHLRFWWRAIRGGRFNGKLEAMKEAEDKIFGAAVGNEGNPSQVQITVFDCVAGAEDRPFEVVAGSSGSRGAKPKLQPRRGSVVPPYAAFTLQPRAEDLKPGMDTPGVRTGVSFTVGIVFTKDIADEVEAALWGWETFGGIGARTRRGFGALRLLKVDGQNSQPPKTSKLEEEIKRGLETYLTGSRFPDGVPHLSGAPLMKITPKHNNANAAWNYLIEKLRQFRQYRKDTEGNLSTFGKSQWPEPDAIRYLAEKISKPSIDKYPRADFGLPIIFHMYHDNLEATLKGNGVGDGKHLERLASPLILRPYLCSDGAVGLGIVLDTPRIPPNGLVLSLEREDKDVTAKLEINEAKELTKRLELLKNNTDVLQAFLNTLST